KLGRAARRLRSNQVADVGHIASRRLAQGGIAGKLVDLFLGQAALFAFLRRGPLALRRQLLVECLAAGPRLFKLRLAVKGLLNKASQLYQISPAALQVALRGRHGLGTSEE